MSEHHALINRKGLRFCSRNCRSSYKTPHLYDDEFTDNTLDHYFYGGEDDE